MEKQIDLWEKESISERGSVAQNLKTKLSETKEKLDKLVSLYLDSDIERDIYLQQKDLLLRQKAKFEESFKDFGQQRKNWVEPCSQRQNAFMQLGGALGIHGFRRRRKGF